MVARSRPSTSQNPQEEHKIVRAISFDILHKIAPKKPRFRPSNLRDFLIFPGHWRYFMWFTSHPGYSWRTGWRLMNSGGISIALVWICLERFKHFDTTNQVVIYVVLCLFHENLDALSAWKWCYVQNERIWVHVLIAWVMAMTIPY